MSKLVDKIVALHEHLDAHRLPHAFGGALALASCTQRARGTIDIDVNVFVSRVQVDALVAALPEGVQHEAYDRAALLADGQTRLWWGRTPVDVFLNTTPFHEAAAGRVRVERFADHDFPFLACRDLAVFKGFVDRSQDWVDLEEMHAAGALDAEAVMGVLAMYLGGDDHRVHRLRELVG